MLRKQVHPWCPESALLFNVLIQAIEDLAEHPGVVQTRAYNYIRQGDHHELCTLLGLNTEYVDELLDQLGLLVLRELTPAAQAAGIHTRTRGAVRCR